MVEVSVPLDVVAAVTVYLRGKGLNARSQVPEHRTPGMIRVSRVGGVPVPDHVRDQPRLLIECWHETQAESFDLAQLVFRALWVTAALTYIFSMLIGVQLDGRIGRSSWRQDEAGSWPSR